MGKKENDKMRSIYYSFMFNYKCKIDNLIYIYFNISVTSTLPQFLRLKIKGLAPNPFPIYLRIYIYIKG